jgi:hypothetical protein
MDILHKFQLQSSLTEEEDGNSHTQPNQLQGRWTFVTPSKMELSSTIQYLWSNGKVKSMLEIK